MTGAWPQRTGGRCAALGAAGAVTAILAAKGIPVDASWIEGDRLVLKRSADAIRFVHPPGYSYFTMLREKLRWSKAVGSSLQD